VLIGSLRVSSTHLKHVNDWVHECSFQLWGDPHHDECRMDWCIKGNFKKHLEVCYAYSQILCWCQVCQDSGKLQFVDATGALDLMIPDVQCFANLSSTYQVAVFQPVLLFPSLSP
jgi:hypothetical protein